MLQAVIHGMLFAFVYLVLQKRQALSEGKGEALFSTRVSNLLLFLSVFSFIVRLFVRYVFSTAAPQQTINAVIPSMHYFVYTTFCSLKSPMCGENTCT